MRQKIKKLLREIAESQTKKDLCGNDESSVEMIKTFGIWRTAMCHSDTFPNVNELTNKYFNKSDIFIGTNQEGEKVQYKKNDLVKKWNDDYKKRLNMCGSPYNQTDTKIESDQACNSEIVKNDYNNDEIREKFNSYMKFPPRCHASYPNTCIEYNQDLSHIDSKKVDKLDINLNQPEIKTSANINQIPNDKKNLLIQNIRKGFEKIKQNLSYQIYNLKN